MSVSYNIETSCAWSPVKAVYIAEITLTIHEDSGDRGNISAGLRSATELMSETLEGNWGDRTSGGRCRSIQLQSDSLAELDGMAEEAIALIRKQMQAVRDNNKEKVAACQDFARTVVVHLD